MNKQLVRVNSHRARKKMFALIGPQKSYFSWSRHCAGGFYRVSAKDLPAVLAIKGISRARDGDDILTCIDFG